MKLIFKGNRLTNFCEIIPRTWHDDDDITNSICIHCDNPDYKSKMCTKVTQWVKSDRVPIRIDSNLCECWRTIY